MAIGNVIQKNGVVYVYKENGNMGVQINVSGEPGSGLTGFTSNTFNIQQGSSVYTYNENGSVIGSHYVGASARSNNSSGGGSFISQIFGVFLLGAVYWYFFL